MLKNLLVEGANALQTTFVVAAYKHSGALPDRDIQEYMLEEGWRIQEGDQGEAQIYHPSGKPMTGFCPIGYVSGFDGPHLIYPERREAAWSELKNVVGEAIQLRLDQ